MNYTFKYITKISYLIYFEKIKINSYIIERIAHNMHFKADGKSSLPPFKCVVRLTAH